jgi:long-subunit acyl-CoA synthetase (AMP-forming)
LVLPRYYNDKEATRKTFRDGWFCTGDLAVRMPGGELNILDRGKDVIISGGA